LIVEASQLGCFGGAYRIWTRPGHGSFHAFVATAFARSIFQSASVARWV